MDTPKSPPPLPADTTHNWQPPLPNEPVPEQPPLPIYDPSVPLADTSVSESTNTVPSMLPANAHSPASEFSGTPLRSKSNSKNINDCSSKLKQKNCDKEKEARPQASCLNSAKHDPVIKKDNESLSITLPISLDPRLGKAISKKNKDGLLSNTSDNANGGNAKSKERNHENKRDYPQIPCSNSSEHGSATKKDQEPQSVPLPISLGPRLNKTTSKEEKEDPLTNTSENINKCNAKSEQSNHDKEKEVCSQMPSLKSAKHDPTTKKDKEHQNIPISLDPRLHKTSLKKGLDPLTNTSISLNEGNTKSKQSIREKKSYSQIPSSNIAKHDSASKINSKQQFSHISINPRLGKTSLKKDVEKVSSNGCHSLEPKSQNTSSKKMFSNELVPKLCKTPSKKDTEKVRNYRTSPVDPKFHRAHFLKKDTEKELRNSSRLYELISLKKDIEKELSNYNVHLDPILHKEHITKNDIEEVFSNRSMAFDSRHHRAHFGKKNTERILNNRSMPADIRLHADHSTYNDIKGASNNRSMHLGSRHHRASFPEKDFGEVFDNRSIDLDLRDHRVHSTKKGTQKELGYRSTHLDSRHQRSHSSKKDTEKISYNRSKDLDLRHHRAHSTKEVMSNRSMDLDRRYHRAHSTKKDIEEVLNNQYMDCDLRHHRSHSSKKDIENVLSNRYTDLDLRYHKSYSTEKPIEKVLSNRSVSYGRRHNSVGRASSIIYVGVDSGHHGAHSAKKDSGKVLNNISSPLDSRLNKTESLKNDSVIDKTESLKNDSAINKTESLKNDSVIITSDASTPLDSKHSKTSLMKSTEKVSDSSSVIHDSKFHNEKYSPLRDSNKANNEFKSSYSSFSEDITYHKNSTFPSKMNQNEEYSQNANLEDGEITSKKSEKRKEKESLHHSPSAKRCRYATPEKNITEHGGVQSKHEKHSNHMGHSIDHQHIKQPECSPWTKRSHSEKEKKVDVVNSSSPPTKKHRGENPHSTERRKYRRHSSPINEPYFTNQVCKIITSSSAEDFYTRPDNNSKEVLASPALVELINKFKYELLERAQRVKSLKPKYEPPPRKIKLRKIHSLEKCTEDSSSSSSCEEDTSDEDTSIEELEKKRQHPDRLHPELWFNDPKEMNDGPLCRCSMKARRTGIRHGVYVGENKLPLCNPHSNNADKLFHYKITINPITNFTTENPTTIEHNNNRYVFEGFSLLSHGPLPELPPCKVIRFNYEYTVFYVEEKMPTNFTVAGLDSFSQFLFVEILELVDIEWKAKDDEEGCPRFHFLPRFSRKISGGGKEVLSFNVVLEYLLNSKKILVDKSKLEDILKYSPEKWQRMADKVKGMIVTCPGMKPSSLRVDQLDRNTNDPENGFPVIVHFGVRPPQLSYAGNPEYQKAWREYVKYRHLLANKPKVQYCDRHKLFSKELKLQEMRMENDLKRDVTVVISSEGFYRTGIMSDVIQHAMMLPVLVCHLRFHNSLDFLEQEIGYKFKDRFVLQLALTHPSYRENFGTNPDHARNSLTNCGLRQPQYGDRRIHYMNTRKRGINTLINIMSRFGSDIESSSSIFHNERLEFLGDAVVEFLSSIHLFYMFPDLEEGGLATYRAAIVQNQHLAVLSKNLNLEQFMLYAHGSDLCHDLELRHAMANCFEALMGALFLDSGIEIADVVFSNTLFPQPELQEVWKNYPLHPLQIQEPDGDRKWISKVPLLQKILKFEKQIGIEFNHIRLLARALTHRSLGYNNLTLGSNQRLEFLGDTVLQLIASEYLYKFFPNHHEGHLSLLRSSLVNNRTQAVVCEDLGMEQYAIYPTANAEAKPKDKADLLEAFLGALYVDKDLGYCRKFCEICFFPRLQHFILNQDWNDPKSKLQQCCLTLRSMDGGEPDIPTYKVIECKGPTNTRVYSVAVYFQGKRLAVGDGHSIQLAEMNAATHALQKSKDLFPQLKHQRRAIQRSIKQDSSQKFDKVKRKC